MKKYLVLLLLKTFMTFSQAPVIEWQKNYGGNNWDRMTDGIQTSDGGYLYGGFSNSTIGFDITQNSTDEYKDTWVVKTNTIGVIEWKRKIRAPFDERWVSVCQTLDGSFVIAIETESDIGQDKTTAYLGNSDIWLVKLSNLGVILWQKELGGTGIEEMPYIIATSDGGCVVGCTSYSHPSITKNEDCIGGSSNPDYWVVKLNTLGVIEWDNTIGGIYNDNLADIKQTTDGGYVVCGYSNSNISGDKTSDNYGIDPYFPDFWILKLNSNGIIEWDKTINGSGPEYYPKIIQSQDGGFLLGGASESFYGGDKINPLNVSNSFWLIKLNNLGNIEWERTIASDPWASLKSINKTTDGGFIIGTTSIASISGDKTESSRGYDDYWIIKINSLGQIIWDKTIGGTSIDKLTSVIQTNDNGFMVLGWAGLQNLLEDVTVNGYGGQDFWVVKLSPDTLSTNSFANAATNIYPNPTNGTFNINFGQQLDQATLKLTNVLGQVVSSKTVTNLESTTYEINEPHGIYFLEIESQDNERMVFKIIKN